MVLIATRLGVIACRYLVEGYGEGRYISVPEIADKFSMNARALMPAMRQLVRVGLLRSRVGGNTPGFIFSKDPKDITLYQILVALEGETRFVCCEELIPGLRCDCKDKTQCKFNSMFGGIMDGAILKLSSISISDYANEKNTRSMCY